MKLLRRSSPSTILMVVSMIGLATSYVAAFAPVQQVSTKTCNVPSVATRTTTKTSSTSLYAIGALAKKAKEASLRQYIADGIEDDVMEQYKIIKAALEKGEEGDSSEEVTKMGPLQEVLTRRRGTITVIAEYKRKLPDSGFIQEIWEPGLLSREFREFGAHGIAVMADERMGGCTYDDLKVFVEDQRRAKNEVPGPVLVINNDLVIDELQVARTAAAGAAALVITLGINGAEQTKLLLQASAAVGLEAIVAVNTKEEGQTAVDLGAKILSIVNVDGVDDKVDIIDGLDIPDDGRTVTTIANIVHSSDKGLQEVEEAWACRDKGFNCAWISDALYKAGNSEVEHPGAIIRSMSSKSSVKWASPVARSGRGEGAREYLGDIMM